MGAFLAPRHPWAAPKKSILNRVKTRKKLGNRNIWRTYPKGIRNNGVKNELDKIEQLEEEIKQKNLIYRTNKYKKDFQQHETLRSFGESSYAGKITVDEAEEDQSNLLKL